MTDISHPNWPGRTPASVRLVDPPPPTQPEQAVEQPRERTDLEIIAAWVGLLTYGNMKSLSAAILGDGATSEQVIEHADKLHLWSEKTKVPS